MLVFGKKQLIMNLSLLWELCYLPKVLGPFLIDGFLLRSLGWMGQLKGSNSRLVITGFTQNKDIDFFDT